MTGVAKSTGKAPRAAGRKAVTKSPKSPKSPAAKVGKTAKAAKTAAASKIPKVKVAAEHPSYLEMITEAINVLNVKKGASRQAIHKHIVAQYNLGAATDKMVRSRLALALKKGVTTGTLQQPSLNRFKLPKDAQKASTPKVGTPKTPTTPKSAKKTNVVAASPSEKKSSTPKTTAVKPTVKKSKKAPSKKTAANTGEEAVVAAV
uniref:H15 domain-containing protein n=1 Tax=Caenorhabditis tropicalis TaxID=1561998 RepID=A0A1I7TML7_9PELO